MRPWPFVVRAITWSSASPMARSTDNGARHRRRGDLHQHIAVCLSRPPQAAGGKLVRRRSCRERARTSPPAAAQRLPTCDGIARARPRACRAARLDSDGIGGHRVRGRAVAAAARGRRRPYSPKSVRTVAIWVSADPASPYTIGQSPTTPDGDDDPQRLIELLRHQREELVGRALGRELPVAEEVTPHERALAVMERVRGAGQQDDQLAADGRRTRARRFRARAGGALEQLGEAA